MNDIAVQPARAETPLPLGPSRERKSHFASVSLSSYRKSVAYTTSTRHLTDQYPTHKRHHVLKLFALSVPTHYDIPPRPINVGP